MEPGAAPRPRVSRETRLLLVTILISLTALWVLARIRFPERPPIPSPVPPLLSQLAPQLTFEDLAAAVAKVDPVVTPSLHLVSVPQPPHRAAATGFAQLPALRIGTNAAVAWLDPAAPNPPETLARDEASGLAVLRVPDTTAAPPIVWAPQRPHQPRYFVVTDTSDAGLSLRPVFVGPLRPIDSPVWSAPVWTIPSGINLVPGAFVFTTTGAFAGLAVEAAERTAIVPAATVVATAERLLAGAPAVRMRLGVDVQALTPEIRAATGAGGGVVITWVDPGGPAAKAVVPTDIVEAINGTPVPTPEHWRAHVLRLRPDEDVSMRVLRQGRLLEVAIPAGAGDARSASSRSGLTLRSVPRVGAEVLAVDPGSVAGRAGLRRGDIVTRMGSIASPTAGQVNSVLSDPSGGVVLAAVTRGDGHFVVVLMK